LLLLVKTKRKQTKAKRTKKPAIDFSRLDSYESIEPDAKAKRTAFFTVLALVLVMGFAGAAIELFLQPLLHRSLGPQEQPVQTVYTTVHGDRYEPRVHTIRAREPVEWVLDTTNATGCTQQLIIPDLSITRTLATPQDTIRFLVEEPTTLPFACSNTSVQGYFLVE
jgi:hypothetical protein